MGGLLAAFLAQLGLLQLPQPGLGDAVGARLLAGRLFDRSRGEDNSDWRYAPGRSGDDRVANVVLNASAARS